MKKKRRLIKKGGVEWFIILPEGSIIEVKKFPWEKYKDLKIFYLYESIGSRKVKEPPIHVKIMKKLELVDYEPCADAGNFRWLPKGKLIKNLLEKHISKIIQDYRAMEVETPIMYDFNHPQLSQYLKRFPARQYKLLSGKKKYFLRFAACFGQYLIMNDMKISYRNLPLRLFELTHYSFRREFTGELAGLRRLRTFTMPDMHTLCADVEEAKKEFYQQYLLCKKWMKDLELDHVMVIRTTEDFFEQNRDFIFSLVKDFGKPALFEKWKKKFFYFILKFEFNIIDSQKKAAALSTIQIDVENAKRFEIQYVDKEGRLKFPFLLHSSISGSIERNLYALLEQQARKLKKGEIPQLPFWLSPVQVRLIPVGDRYLPRCCEIADQLSEIRVEIDDRNERVSKKILQAETNWIPFIIVIGDKELKRNTISVRERKSSKLHEMEVKDLEKILKQLQNDRPFEPLNWSRFLSKQPKFI